MMSKTKMFARVGIALTVVLGFTLIVSPAAATTTTESTTPDTDADTTTLLHENCERVTDNGVAEEKLQPAEEECEDTLTSTRDTVFTVVYSYPVCSQFSDSGHVPPQTLCKNARDQPINATVEVLEDT
jgi:hypothetical protein